MCWRTWHSAAWMVLAVWRGGWKTASPLSYSLKGQTLLELNGIYWSFRSCYGQVFLNREESWLSQSLNILQQIKSRSSTTPFGVQKWISGLGEKLLVHQRANATWVIRENSKMTLEGCLGQKRKVASCKNELWWPKRANIGGVKFALSWMPARRGGWVDFNLRLYLRPLGLEEDSWVSDDKRWRDVIHLKELELRKQLSTPMNLHKEQTLEVRVM